jgi:hypothetical protein
VDDPAVDQAVHHVLDSARKIAGRDFQQCPICGSRTWKFLRRPIDLWTTGSPNSEVGGHPSDPMIVKAACLVCGQCKFLWLHLIDSESGAEVATESG